MKKYVKPELLYEHFVLSQRITADCAWEWETMTNENTCYALPDLAKLPYPGRKLFATVGICTLNSGEYTDYCYQNDNDGANLFYS